MDKRFWSGRIQDLEPYIPGEQPKDRVFIKLNTNENPYPPSPKVLEAIRSAADETLRLYPDPEASQLRQTIAEYTASLRNRCSAATALTRCWACAFTPSSPRQKGDLP